MPVELAAGVTAGPGAVTPVLPLVVAAGVRPDSLFAPATEQAVASTGMVQIAAIRRPRDTAAEPFAVHPNLLITSVGDA